MPKPKPPPAVPTFSNVTYTTTPATLACDIRQPPTGVGPWPCVIMIFGGAWKQGSKEDVASQAIRVSSEEGYVTVCPNHRLAPDGGTWHAPAPMEDLRALFDWLAANAATYGIDQTRIASMGGSSGGHLSMMLGADRPLRCVVSASGPTALDLFDDDGGGSAEGIVTNFMGFAELGHTVEFQAASPLYRVVPGYPPTYLVYSQKEPIPSQQGVRMQATLDAASVATVLRIPDGSAHGWNIWATESWWSEAMGWLRTYLP